MSWFQVAECMVRWGGGGVLIYLRGVKYYYMLTMGSRQYRRQEGFSMLTCCAAVFQPWLSCIL